MSPEQAFCDFLASQMEPSWRELIDFIYDHRARNSVLGSVGGPDSDVGHKTTEIKSLF